MFRGLFWGSKESSLDPSSIELDDKDPEKKGEDKQCKNNEKDKAFQFPVMNYPVLYKKTMNRDIREGVNGTATTTSRSSKNINDNNNNNNNNIEDNKMTIPKRRYIKGYRRNGTFPNNTISFEKLSWITQPEDLKLIKSVCGAAFKCAEREGSSLKDIEVHDDTPSEEKEQVPDGSNAYLLYRVVISLCGNVAVSKRFLDTIEAKDSFRIDSIGVATYVPEDLCDQSKEEIVTQIIVYVRSFDHQKLKKEIECNTFSQALKPSSLKKRKTRDF